jgi:hypothetical protein
MLKPITDYVPLIAPFVQGCPSAIVADAIRQSVIELCRRAGVWSGTLSPIPMTAGQDEYPLESPEPDQEVDKVSTAWAGKRELVGLASEREAIRRFRNRGSGAPLVFVQTIRRTVRVFPAPDMIAELDTLELFVRFRPAARAVSVDSALMDAFTGAVRHGALYQLYLMPLCHWTDDKLAVFHGKEWTFYLAEARAVANSGYGAEKLNAMSIPWDRGG